MRAASSGSTSTNWLFSTSYTGSTGGGSGFAWTGSPSAKSCSLTDMMSAKSQPISSPSVKEMGSIPSLRSMIRSCIPSPTNRRRMIESVSCGSPPASGLRR